MNMLISDTVLIAAAAGASRRFGERNKMFAMLQNVPVFLHCLRTIAPLLVPDRIILTVPPGGEAPFREAAELFLPDVQIRYVAGGATRTESVRNALNEAKKIKGVRFAAIHDAARPFLTADMFTGCLDAARKYGGALLCRRICDTVKVIQDGFSVSTLDRDTLRGAETPQIFALDALCQAYDKAQNAPGPFTDDAQIMERFSDVRPYLLEHRGDNRKITYAEDLP